MRNPLVSIIMGAYNCESTITECINSVINQTYKNWEFIICDDCSKDSTRKILLEYTAKDERIHIISNDRNSRLAASLNNCLGLAKGKYVARMDADDTCMPERLQKQVDFMEENPEYDCVGTNRIVFDSNGDICERASIEYPQKEILLTTTPFAHPTIMMKKIVYDALSGYTVSKETMRAEDLDLWFRFFEQGFKGYNMQESLYRYRESETDFSKRSLEAGIQTSKIYLKGYQLINIPVYKRVYALKPILTALIPNKLMQKYHQKTS